MTEENKADPSGQNSEIIAETYRLIRQIGTGGMGTIYEAENIRVGRKFAIKLLKVDLAKNQEVFQRFKREAQIAGRLGHPNMVEVVDFNITKDGAPYIVMEKLDGEDLSQRLKRTGALSLAQTLSMLGEVVDALEAAHQAGVVHRDMKPENIFLCKHGRRDDLVKLLDFGISKIKAADTVLTQTNAVMGTPYYMSPEQAQGKTAEIDTRTDVFALGSIVYEMLTGQSPFRAPTVPTALFKVCFEEPEPIESQVEGLPAGLPEVLRKALKKEKNERYSSVRAFFEDIVRVANGQAPTFESGKLATLLDDKEARQDPQGGAAQPAAAATVQDPTTLSGSAAESTAVDSLPNATIAPPKRSVFPVIGITAVVVLMLAGGGIYFGTDWLSGRPAQTPAARAKNVSALDDRGGKTGVDEDDDEPAHGADEVVLKLYINPKDAELFIDDEAITQHQGQIKRVLILKKGDKPQRVAVKKDGYKTHEQILVPDESQRITVMLRKEKAQSASAPPDDYRRGHGRRRRRRRGTRAAVRDPRSGAHARPTARPRPHTRTRRRTRSRKDSRRGGGAGADIDTL
jgi:serine/threonine protein kinase